MKSTKLFKKIDPRVIQALVMIVIAVLFLYVCYYFYGEFSAYVSAKKREAGGVVDAAGVQAPEFHHFVPKKEELHRYQLFTFPEKRTVPPETLAGGSGRQRSAAAQSSDYKILGVVKKDRYYLVVRYNNGKVSLIGAGQAIRDRVKVKSLTAHRAVITGPDGGEQVYKVFRLEAKTIKQKSRGVIEKKQ